MNAPNTPNAQRSTPNAPAPFVMTTSEGVIAEPERVVIHGDGGLGKSTMLAGAPAPYFIDLDKGTKQINVRRNAAIDSWEHLLACVRWFITEPHDRQTLVIDTLDRAEWLCWQYVCRVAGKPSIESFPFGKGLVAVYEAFRVLARELETLRARRRMRIVILSHSKLETVPNPSGEDWQRWTLKVDKRVAGLFSESFDAILFAHKEVFTRTTEAGKVKGVGNERVLETEGAPGWVAKNRYGLPAQLPMPLSGGWDILATAMARGAEGVLAAIRAEIDDALVRLAALDSDAATKAQAQLAETPDEAARLSLVLNRINAGITAREAASTDNAAPSADNA